MNNMKFFQVFWHFLKWKNNFFQSCSKLPKNHFRTIKTKFGKFQIFLIEPFHNAKGKTLSKQSQFSIFTIYNMPFNSPNPWKLWYKNAKYYILKSKKHYRSLFQVEGVKKFTYICPYFLSPYLGGGRGIKLIWLSRTH